LSQKNKYHAKYDDFFSKFNVPFEPSVTVMKRSIEVTHLHELLYDSYYLITEHTASSHNIRVNCYI